ncbi:MAG TPA: MlaE family lipid ABC transporter permease subunit [Terriglobales bacterium]|nr:MlaE family lipid ABC transporter permease subunit [Terriglobales bacterium]
MLQSIRHLGATTTAFVYHLGRITLFALAIARAVVTPPARFRVFINEIFNLGVLSLVIVGVCGLVVGMVLGLQGYNTLVRFGAEESLGAVVGLSLIRELGPVLTALLTTGRAGSATAAEIGAMVRTEQLDGLRMMSIDPMHLVVSPKVLAMIAVMPLLTALFIVCGLGGGYFVGVNLKGVDAGSYWSSLHANVVFSDDIAGSMLKALIFGILVALVSTYRGYTCAPTAAGVSSATTSTVVVASVAIFISDYFITALWGV